MTNEEAIKYLIPPIATSTEPSAEYLKQKEAYELAIKALEKEAKIEERKAKEKAEKEKIKALATLYDDLKEGELFRMTFILSDERIYRKDHVGATLIKDRNGNTCNYKEYPYLGMIVYKLSEVNNDNN